MTDLTRRDLTKLLAAGALAGVLPGRALASELELKMILNWRYQGPQGWFFLAEDNGYLAEAGIHVAMDQGNGSGAAVGQVAGGAYDIGFGDVNALIQLVSERPGEDTPLAVYMMYNRPPFTIAVMSSSDIHSPEDFEGRVLGGSATDGALKLFPAFASITGIDTSGIEIVNFQPNLREQMLKSGQVDGVFGFVNTIRFSAMLSGMNPDEEIRFINYGDYGMDLYSNALIVSRRLVNEHPDAVRGVVRAFNRGLVDSIADPDAAIAAVSRREPLINAEVEKLRLIATLRDEMNHPEVATYGIGDVDPDRFARSIDIVVEANDLPRTPAPDEIFDRSFLPPEDERVRSPV